PDFRPSGARLRVRQRMERSDLPRRDSKVPHGWTTDACRPGILTSSCPPSAPAIHRGYRLGSRDLTGFRHDSGFFQNWCGTGWIKQMLNNNLHSSRLLRLSRTTEDQPYPPDAPARAWRVARQMTDRSPRWRVLKLRP